MELLRTSGTIIETVGKSGCFAIYGAQVVAHGVFAALRGLCGVLPECFIVSSAEGNPAEIEGTPVRELSKCLHGGGLDSGTLILVAVTELFQDEICAALERSGFCNYIRVSAHEEHLLMSAYFDSIGRFPLLEDCRNTDSCVIAAPGSEGDDTSTHSPVIDFVIYEAKNHRDKPLFSPPVLKPWERTIQAGADVTDIRFTRSGSLTGTPPLLDNAGENISSKNKMYSEMTVTYWVWKNTAHDWKGICHYRRHLVLSDGQIASLAKSGAGVADGAGGVGRNIGVDAVLPLPYICYPDTLAQFGRFVSRAVVDALLDTLKTLHPDLFEQCLSILGGLYQYTYNLLAARRDVFDGYCAWAFDVLGHMERYADKVPEIASTRALSYAAEVVTSLYFMLNAGRLNIRHIEKAIYT